MKEREKKKKKEREKEWERVGDGGWEEGRKQGKVGKKEKKRENKDGNERKKRERKRWRKGREGRERGRTNLGRAWWYDCSLQSTLHHSDHFLEGVRVSLPPGEELWLLFGQKKQRQPRCNSCFSGPTCYLSALSTPPRTLNVPPAGLVIQLSCLERWPRSSLPVDLSPSPGHGGSVVHLSPKWTQNPKGGLLGSKYPPGTMCHSGLVWSEHSCQDKSLQPVHLYRYIPLSFPETASTRSSKFPCLISSNPHESMDILTLSRFSVHTQSITKGTSQNPAQWEHLPSPRFSGPSWMGLLGAASLAITNKLSKLMSEPSQHLPPLSDGCKEPQFPQKVRGEGWQMGW